MRSVFLAAAAAVTACAPQGGAAASGQSGASAPAPDARSGALPAQAGSAARMDPSPPVAGPGVPLPAALAADGTPEAFVRSLYARYAATAASQDPNGPEWRDENVYAPSLIALMERDRALHPDEVGFVDADVVCQCQDTGGVRLRDVQTRETGPNRAEANVHFDFTEAGSDRRIVLKLLRTPGGWRIEDVASQDEPSFAAAIRQANAEAERQAGSGPGAGR